MHFSQPPINTSGKKTSQTQEVRNGHPIVMECSSCLRLRLSRCTLGMLDFSAKSNPKKRAMVRYVCEFEGGNIWGFKASTFERVEDYGSIFGFLRIFWGISFKHVQLKC